MTRYFFLGMIVLMTITGVLYKEHLRVNLLRVEFQHRVTTLQERQDINRRMLNTGILAGFVASQQNTQSYSEYSNAFNADLTDLYIKQLKKLTNDYIYDTHETD